MDANDRSSVWLILVTLLSFALVLTARFQPWKIGGVAPRLAEDGVLDLRSWDFSSDGEAPLIGEWVFTSAAGRRVRGVPDQWKGTDAGAENGQGYGEYRLTVMLPEDAPPLALRVTTMATAFEIRANGRVIAGAGIPSDDPAHAVAAYAPQVADIANEIESDPRGVLDLAVVVSNWEYRVGGMWEAPVLGDRDHLVEIKQRADDTAYMQYVFFLSVAGIAVTVFLVRRSEIPFLIFGMFCVSMALRVLCTGEYLVVRRFPEISFDAIVRLEYLSVLLAVPLAFLFFRAFFPYLAGKRLTVVLTAPYVVFLSLLPFLPLPVLTDGIFVIYAVNFVGIGCLATLAIIRVLPREKVEGTVVIFGALFLAAAVVNDSLHESYIIRTATIAQFFVVVFIGLLAVVLSRRLLVELGRTENLSKELTAANVRIQRDLENIDAARMSLESALHDREMLVREIHHRVKNSLQIVASIISLHLRRTEDQATRDAFLELTRRIHVIGLVHEKLYGMPSFSKLGVNDYVRDLIHLLDSAYASEDFRIELTQPETDRSGTLEFCLDLGLMVNELVSNAFKHGPPACRCSVELRYIEQSLQIEVRNPVLGDNRLFENSSDSGLGFKILKTLLRRSGGTVETTVESGYAVVVLTIPMPRTDGAGEKNADAPGQSRHQP